MKNIAAALLSVQKNLDPVHKGRKGYGYNYADLPAVMDSCVEKLNEAGVVVVQSPTVTEKQAAAIITRLIHAETCEEVTSTIEVPWAVGKTQMSDAQAYGSAMTYARRYALVSMLGIVTEDDDGASAGNRPKRAEKPNSPQPLPAEKAAKVSNAITVLAPMNEAEKLEWLTEPTNMTMVKWLKDNRRPEYADFVSLGVEVA